MGCKSTSVSPQCILLALYCFKAVVDVLLTILPDSSPLGYSASENNLQKLSMCRFLNSFRVKSGPFPLGGGKNLKLVVL